MTVTDIRVVLAKLRRQALGFTLAELPVPYWLQQDMDWWEFLLSEQEGPR